MTHIVYVYSTQLPNASTYGTTTCCLTVRRTFYYSTVNTRYSRYTHYCPQSTSLQQSCLYHNCVLSKSLHIKINAYIIVFQVNVRAFFVLWQSQLQHNVLTTLTGILWILCNPNWNPIYVILHSHPSLQPPVEHFLMQGYPLHYDNAQPVCSNIHRFIFDDDEYWARARLEKIQHWHEVAVIEVEKMRQSLKERTSSTRNKHPMLHLYYDWWCTVMTYSTYSTTVYCIPS